MTAPISDNARVLKFTGAWKGRFEQTDNGFEAQQNALADARNIIAAKSECDDWTARLLMGLLCILDEDQLTRLEIALCQGGDCGEAQRQSIALIRLRHSCKAHRERVKSAIAVLQEREAF